MIFPEPGFTATVCVNRNPTLWTLSRSQMLVNWQDHWRVEPLRRTLLLYLGRVFPWVKVRTASVSPHIYSMISREAGMLSPLWQWHLLSFCWEWDWELACHSGALISHPVLIFYYTCFGRYSKCLRMTFSQTRYELSEGRLDEMFLHEF